ncbi:zinc finger protein 32 isoform X2 [Tribolium castaneum]|uniref:zinc finger protein 32 isoform X2 n=1 Tax=Tribolium castaneum TaxID=7070 RepID=UPI00046C054C|nr:PREDICTED: zinc finger protein 32 isoform X2 [Tribolium castaneum]|eukprot:XP_008198933.1 PREDICTED: zinc finger protein 32 isoform X2 [Tribolium castaneum]
MENVRTLDLDKICRTCLTENKDMFSIFSQLYEVHSQESDIPCIDEILSKISSIKAVRNDGFPSLICTKCIDLAHTSFNFQKLCNRSQNILETFVKQQPETSIKLENVEKNEFLVVERASDEESDKADVPGQANEEEKNFACTICEKSYKFANSLRVHMRNHSEEKPYECKTCGKCFKQYGSLVYHQRSHTGVQPYVCKTCGKKYKQSGTLTAHMRVHTGQRPFLCSICGRGFRQAADLGYHMRSHTKEKPYMCNICGKTMSMQSHLVQHLRTHTGERPYKLCVGRRFRRRLGSKDMRLSILVSSRTLVRFVRKVSTG